MRDAPLPVERSLGIVKQAASALGAAHAKGIVHRDVKPENVYLVRRGEQDFVKVVDFGVSKAVRSREEAGSEWQRLTRTGAVLGTPLFMSPEQAAGREDIDERADIWAAALILYECLTGELPFRGNNYLGVVAQIQNQAVQPPSALRPELGIPPAVDRVLMRGLEKDRTRRYQRMAELERDIDRLLAGDVDAGFPEGAGEAMAAKARRRGRWPVHLGVAAIFAVGIGTAALLARTGRQTEKPAAAPPSAVAPRPSAPAPKAVAPPPPPSEPPASASSERVRRPAKGHLARPIAPVAETPPPEKKTKADDKIAPSPYTSP
jgi:serine/threonine-protein kinase